MSGATGRNGRSSVITSPESSSVRLAHFSDIHVTAPRCVWRVRDWMSKRLSSWVNLRLLGRARRFRHTDRVLAALLADLRQRRFDRVVFSGDATALGFEEEMARAAELLGLGQPDALHGLAVPGNHDYCTHAAMRGGHFERHFAPWLHGERIDEAIYPFAQRVGPAWLVAVCSAKANVWPTDASGAVGVEQLRRLDLLLARLDDGPRILVTHYPVLDAGGKPERRGHGLHDLTDVLAVARSGGVSLWLHGHLHHDYHHLPSEHAPFPILCAGSATQRYRWSYGEYTLTGRHLHVLRRVYDAGTERFVDRESFELELPKV